MSNQLLPDISQGQWDTYQADQFQERVATDLDRVDWHQATSRALEAIAPPPPLPPLPPEPAPAEVPETPVAVQAPAPPPAPVVPPPPPPAPVPAAPVPEDFPAYGASASAPPAPAPDAIPAYQPNAGEALTDGGSLPSLPAAAAPPPSAPSAPAAPATGNAWLDRVGGMLAAIPSGVSSAAGQVSQAAIGTLNAGGEALSDVSQGARAGNLQQRGIELVQSDSGPLGGPLSGPRRWAEDQNAASTAGENASYLALGRVNGINAGLTDAQVIEQGRNAERLGESAALGVENVALEGAVARRAVPLSARGNARDAAGERIATAARQAERAAARAGVGATAVSRSAQIEEAIRGGASLEQAVARVDAAASERLPATAQIGPGRSAGTGLLDAAGNPVGRAATEGRGLLGPTGRALPKTPSVAEVVPDIAPEVAPVVQRVVDAAVSTVPPARATIVDKVLSFTLGNMFSAGTVGVNTVGNVVTAAERPLVSLFSGHPVVAAADIAGMAGGVPKAILAAGKAFLRGDAALAEGAAPDVAAQIGRPEAFPGLAGAVATPIARLNRGIDEFFRTVATAGATQVARVTGLTGDDAIKFIADAADTAVLTGKPSRITEFIGKMGQKSEGHPATDLAFRAAASVWFPFVRIPEEVFKRGVGIAGAPAIQTWKLIEGVGARNPKQAEEASAKLLMGLGLYWAVWHAVHGDNLQATDAGTPQEAALSRGAMDAQGNPILQPGETRIGGRDFPTGLAGQWGNAANLIASAIEGWEDNGKAGKPPPETLERLTNAFGAVAQTGYRQFYLGNFVETMHLVGQRKFDQAANKLLTGEATRTVPAWISQINQLSGDTVVREPTNALEAVEARIPGLSQRVQPKIDPTTGEPVRRSGDALTFLLRSPAPGAPNPVAAEVVRLEAAGNPVSVRQFGKSVNYAGAGQTPEQRRVLQGAFGKATQTYVAELLARPDYQAATDAQKAATLNKALETAYAVADLKAGESVGRDPAHQAALAYASIPHYVGVKGTVEEIRQGNLEHANARAEYQRYVKEFGKDRAELELLRKDKETWRLLQHPELDSELLALRKKKIDAQFAAAPAAAGALRGAAVPVRPAGAGR